MGFWLARSSGLVLVTLLLQALTTSPSSAVFSKKLAPFTSRMLPIMAMTPPLLAALLKPKVP